MGWSISKLEPEFEFENNDQSKLSPPQGWDI
jgi:hypothetical protein